MKKNGSISSINFGLADVKMRVPRAKKVKAILLSIFNDNNKELESLQYVFCSDEYLLGLNQQFLDHDTYTDIITFTLSDPTSAVQGEIYISVDRVKENSTSLEVVYRTELYRVIFHGALHLCGFKDKTTSQKKTMRKQEDFYLSHINSSTWNNSQL